MAYYTYKRTHTHTHAAREKEREKTESAKCAKNIIEEKIATAKNSNEMMIVASTTRTGNVDRKKALKSTASIIIIKKENY